MDTYFIHIFYLYDFNQNVRWSFMIKGYAALLIIDVQVGSFKEERMLYKGIELLKTFNC
jgi:hypothetical protein